MTLKRVLDIVSGNEWFPQGGEGKFIYATLPLVSCMSMTRVYDVNYVLSVAIIDEGFMHWYHSLDGAKKGAAYFLERLRTEANLMVEVERLWKEPREAVEKKVREIVDTDLDAIPLPELIRMFTNLCDASTRQWEPPIFIDMFDVEGERIVSGAIAEWRKDLIPHANTLLHNEGKSFVQRERDDMIRIALAAKQGKAIEDDLRAHQKSFFWYTNNYAHAYVLGVEHFKKRIEELTKLPDEDLEEKLHTEDTIAAERDAMLEDAPEGLKRLLEFFRWMTVLRDRRKEMTCMTHAAMQTLLDAIGSKTGISQNLLHCMLYWEAPSLLDDKDAFVKILEARKHWAMLLVTDDELIVLDGEDARRVYERAERMIAVDDDIRGMCASKGTARGPVRIINKVKDFARFRQGDILVSTMTRPEFQPILDKAVAIVTDEGGITCHAAIVSRELGIPCVIGCGNATQVFKDGDVIEVDTDKGTVRRLEGGT